MLASQPAAVPGDEVRNSSRSPDWNDGVREDDGRPASRRTNGLGLLGQRQGAPRGDGNYGR